MRKTGTNCILSLTLTLMMSISSAFGQGSENSITPAKDEVEKILSLVKFKKFNYSDVSVTDAINQLTNKLYWRGIQVTLSGKRQCSFEAKKSTNGAIFYVSTMQPPLYYDYFLENVTAQQVIDHISYNSDLVYEFKEGEIAFTDRERSGMGDEPEDGYATSGIQKIFKERNLKEMKKYMGQTFKISGILTGMGRGTNSKTLILGLDGGLTRIEVPLAELDPFQYKRMQKKITDWKRDSGPKKLNEAQVRAAREYLELDLREVAHDLFVVLEAKCSGVDKDRLVFKEPKYIFIESEQKYLLKPAKK